MIYTNALSRPPFLDDDSRDSKTILTIQAIYNRLGCSAELQFFIYKLHPQASRSSLFAQAVQNRIKLIDPYWISDGLYA